MFYIFKVNLDKKKHAKQERLISWDGGSIFYSIEPRHSSIFFNLNSSSKKPRTNNKTGLVSLDEKNYVSI
jgi:hypothetical protein